MVLGGLVMAAGCSGPASDAPPPGPTRPQADTCQDVIVPGGGRAADVAVGYEPEMHAFGESAELRVCFIGLPGASAVIDAPPGVAVLPAPAATGSAGPTVLRFTVRVERNGGGAFTIQIRRGGDVLARSAPRPTVVTSEQGWRIVR